MTSAALLLMFRCLSYICNIIIPKSFTFLSSLYTHHLNAARDKYIYIVSEKWYLDYVYSNYFSNKSKMEKNYNTISSLYNLHNVLISHNKLRPLLTRKFSLHFRQIMDHLFELWLIYCHHFIYSCKLYMCF